MAHEVRPDICFDEVAVQDQNNLSDS